jgi:hypothetical protein
MVHAEPLGQQGQKPEGRKMEAGKRIITDIFNRARTLEIPFFQRAYVWEKDNWERFVEDMIQTAESKRPYFMGSVIQKQRHTDSAKPLGDVRSIVDGQQRLTTITIFFRTLFAIREQTQTFDAMFRNFRNELILQHNHVDIEPFDAIVSGTLTPDLESRHPDSRVLQAHHYFESRRADLAGIDPFDLIQLIYFVGIDLGHDEDEQQIFDTINSLGVDLTTAELLKNQLFGRTDVALYERTWRPTFEETEEKRAYWNPEVTGGRSRRQMIDLFLQCYLMIQPDLQVEFRVDRLFHMYKEHLQDRKIDRHLFIEDLTSTAKLFSTNITANSVHREIDPKNAMERLNVLLFDQNTTTVLPYVLFILKTVPAKHEQARMLRLIETYLIRRIVCRETSAQYNKMFASFIRTNLDSYDALTNRISGTKDPTVRMPTDEMFRHGILHANLTNGQARLVLYLLERSIRDDERHSTALSGLSHYSLEHLMPKKWRNHWGTLPEEQARQRDDALRKLGNLSLLSSTLNTSIRDAAWADKKAGRGKGHGLDRFASGLETLAADLAVEVWDEAAIRSRGERLATQATKVWPMPGP